MTTGYYLWPQYIQLVGLLISWFRWLQSREITSDPTTLYLYTFPISLRYVPLRIEEPITPPDCPLRTSYFRTNKYTSWPQVAIFTFLACFFHSTPQITTAKNYLHSAVRSRSNINNLNEVWFHTYYFTTFSSHSQLYLSALAVSSSPVPGLLRHRRGLMILGFDNLLMLITP